MTDQPKRSRWKRRVAVYGVLLLPVAYMFTTGPVSWLRATGHIRRGSPVDGAINVFYEPLNELKQSWEFFRFALRMWTDLWQP